MKIEQASDPSVREHARRRHDFIERCLALVGQTWAGDYVHEISTACRRIEGGWPGRLAEARALALRDLTLQLAARGMRGPSTDELTRAPAIVNDHARQHWGHACKAERLALQVARASTSR
jgi:hypothetical protein